MTCVKKNGLTLAYFAAQTVIKVDEIPSFDPALAIRMLNLTSACVVYSARRDKCSAKVSINQIVLTMNTKSGSNAKEGGGPPRD